jgi:CRISPR-associated protein Cas5
MLYGDERMKFDLSFLLQPPDFSARAKLTVEALAPLSMVTSMPGKYYRSQPEPTDEMLYGLFENALGWHITGKTDTERDRLVKGLARRHRMEERKSGVEFKSLLQFHVRFTTRAVPPLLHYDDYWSRHSKHTDSRHVDGSRNYDYRAIPRLNAVKANEAELNPKEIIKYFPQYYISPTPREYVIPKGAYRYRLETSKEISSILIRALENPSAPLYLGTSDGWIEVSYEELA